MRILTFAFLFLLQDLFRVHLHHVKITAYVYQNQGENRIASKYIFFLLVACKTRTKSLF